MKNTHEIIAANVDNLMKHKQMKQIEFAKNTGLSQRTISNALKPGSVGSVTMDTVEKIAFYFGIEAYHLLIPNLSIADLIDVRIEGVINKYTQTSEHGRQEIIRTADNEFRYHAVSQLASRAKQQQIEPNQEQNRQVMTRKKPSKFEIELAIEQERCVMERHQEAVIANERYVKLIKESCKQNECYCEPPCENATPKITSYSNLIERAKLL
jgi:transcriptional regulator with XRE-family HTH domain